MDIVSIIIGSIVIIALGCLSHFIYNLTHQNKIIGLFVAVNESTWEHIKIAIVPSIIWCLYDIPFFGVNPNYFTAKFFSLLVLIITIPLFFYTYKVFTKKAILPVDIAIFCICIILSQTLFYFILTLAPLPDILNIISFCGIFLALVACILFTVFPPKIFLFKDPVTKGYGYPSHKKCCHAHKHH